MKRLTAYRNSVPPKCATYPGQDKTVGVVRVVRTTSFQEESSRGEFLYSGGKIINNREQMRVAIDSEPDTMELQVADACWHTEDGAEIEIEALIPIAGTNVSGFCATVYPLTKCAAYRFMFA